MQICNSGNVKIFIAGNVQKAKQLCAEFVEKGACVNVVETEYIYKYGMEQGVIVQFINYPRFPKTPDQVIRDAFQLGKLLMHGLHAGSYTVDSSGWQNSAFNTSYFFNRR